MSGLVVTRQQFVITLGNMLPDATIPWIEMVYDLTVKGGFVLLNKKALQQAETRILDEAKRFGYSLELSNTPHQEFLRGKFLVLRELLEGAEK